MNPSSARCPNCGARLTPEGLCLRCALTGEVSDPVEGSGGLPPPTQPSAGTALRYFGHYELLDDGREGGMGVVYKARQATTSRVVALKMLKADCLRSADAVRRFHAEIEAATRLDHPGILPIYEVSEHRGQHYYTMKWIEEGCLSDQVESGRWKLGTTAGRESRGQLEAVARLLEDVARAVHHAHQRGILHRDLKPANILIDGVGRSYVADFGLAKFLNEETRLTRTEAMLGSPRYMSPEQAQGLATEVTTSSDVFSLGVILYELLTGRSPFEGDSALSVIRRVVEHEPRRPSTLNPELDCDLETVCLKCLEKAPTRRYSTAESLADDLARWRCHEPIQARPATPWQRGVKWVQRNPAVAALFALLAVVLFGGFAATLWQLRRAERALAVGRELARHRDARLTQELLAQQKVGDALSLLARQVQEEPDNSIAAARLLMLLTQHDFPLPRGLPIRHGAEVNAVSFSPDGRFLATSSADRTLRVSDAETGRPVLGELRCTGEPSRVIFSPNGQFLAAAASDGLVRVHELPDGTLRGTVVHTAAVRRVTFSPDSRWLATCSDDQTVQLNNARDGKLQTRLTGHKAPVSDVAFSRDGTRLASAGENVRLWEVSSGKPIGILSGHTSTVDLVVFSPDGQHLLSCSSDGTARLWDPARLLPQGEPFRHAGKIHDATFSPDGARVATASEDGTARVWDARSGQPTIPPLEGGRPVGSVRFSPDGKWLLTASDDGTARLWDATTGAPRSEPMRHRSFVTQAVFSPDGHTVATASSDGFAVLWDVRPGNALPQLLALPFPPYRAKLDRTGFRAVVASSAGQAMMVDLPAGTRSVPSLSHGRAVQCAELTPHGRYVVTGSDDHTARFWDSRTGQPLSAPLEHESAVWLAVLDRSSRFAATVTDGSVTRVWEVPGGRLLNTLPPPTTPSLGGPLVCDAVFAPDGRSLLVGGGDGMVRAWPWAGGATNAEVLLKHQAPVIRFRLSPDGRRLATAALDRTTVLAEFPGGRPLCPPLPHDSEAIRVEFSPDGRLLATGTYGGAAQLWDAFTGRPLIEPLRHDAAVMAVAFSPDGQRLATASADTTARIWEVRTGLPIGDPLRHPQRLVNAEFQTDGQRLMTVGENEAVRFWETPWPAGPAPAWLGQLAGALSGLEVPASQPRVSAPLLVLAELRQQLATTTASDAWSRWGRWWAADRALRTASPPTGPVAPR